jgi:hypothetical protein
MATQYYDAYPGIHEMRKHLPCLPTKPFPSPEFIYYWNGSRMVLNRAEDHGTPPLELIIVNAVSIEHGQSRQRLVCHEKSNPDNIVDAVCFDPLYTGLRIWACCRKRDLKSRLC